MSSLQSINGFNLDSDLVQKFLKDYTVLTKNGKNIILCWIPSHVGILGNEKADAAAKSALSLPVTRMKLPGTVYAWKQMSPLSILGEKNFHCSIA